MKLAEPSTLPRGARRFVAYWLQDTAYRFHKHGFRTLIPVRTIVCVAIGAAVGMHANKVTLADTQTMVAVYAAVFTVNAILLAICWGAFSKMFDILSDQDFGAWLRRRRMDGYYSFYIEFIQLMQMLAVATAAVALILSLLAGIPEWALHAALAAVATTSSYAAWWASGCVHIMQDLGDSRSAYLDRRDEVHEMRPQQGREA
ncbi:hypothetical protein [Phenylobacterium sp. J367]|uniref:hypothetical protein n=1 Tax=Phenylobacterium sp. J367 TaxID=2898435 RepID=UPI002150ABEF|nr:hypothetical protein [Phenylobacterium sp. J367]MCR5878413.1 hypothetical protein [Phenylobacterium sp. J367]